VEYQPIIDLQTGSIVGAEALARWDHPSRGWVGPDTFIPLAEELGVVERIDQWVLREACTVGRTWIEDGLPEFKMAVNLSGRDLEQADLVEQIARILHETGFPAGQLELELTEGVAINESSGAQETLEAFNPSGCIWPSTTSARGIRRCLDCAASRLIGSRSTRPSWMTSASAGRARCSSIRSWKWPMSSDWRWWLKESKLTPRPTISASEGATSPRASSSADRWANPNWGFCSKNRGRRCSFRRCEALVRVDGTEAHGVGCRAGEG
jgi:EAL domain